MSDVAGELALLVADTQALLEEWRASGAWGVPVGSLQGLPAADPWPVSAAGAPTRPAPPAGTSATGGVSGRPGTPLRPAIAPSPTAAPSRVPPGPVVERPGPAPLPQGAPASNRSEASPRPAPQAPQVGDTPRLSALFGNKWQVAARDRGAELDALLAGRGVCADCGTAAAGLRGSGRPEARLAIVGVGPGAATLGGEGGAMLDRMLLNVLMVERADTWLLEANACAAAAGSCRDTLRRQLDVVGPRLILGLGAGVGPLLGGLPPVLGEWAAWGEADVLLTFHPSELVRRPADKRPALEHLNTLRRRL